MLGTERRADRMRRPGESFPQQKLRSLNQNRPAGVQAA